jgi:aspartate aminotransferase-like enzyme
MGGTEIKVDRWGLDVCFASSQKCFGVPPGLAVGSVSKEALTKSALMKNKGWYFDFKLWERYHKNDGTPMTSVIPQISGLSQILKVIEGLGGKEEFFKLYLKRSRGIREGVMRLGLSIFPQKGYESPTVSCVNTPGNLRGPEVYDRMRDKGFELAKGYGDVSESTFRIGNMGYIELNDIDLMLQSLHEVLIESS